jgi:hypothetical protein
MPVFKEEMGNIASLNCHIFSAEKFRADGTHDNFKSCMVANGNEQDPDVYLDRSSPMVAIHSIFMCLCLAAYNNTYKVVKLDVKGAYIQTEMQGAAVFMRCNR